MFPISAATGAGTKPLLFKVSEMLKAIPKEPEPTEDTILITPETHRGDAARQRMRRRAFTVERDDESGEYYVRGEGIERLVAMTQLDNDHALTRLQKVMEKSGMIAQLKALGASEGDTVHIGKFEFSYYDEDAEYAAYDEARSRD